MQVNMAYIPPSDNESGRQTAQDCLSSHYNGTDSNYCASESIMPRQPQDRSMLSQHSAYSRQ